MSKTQKNDSELKGDEALKLVREMLGMFITPYDKNYDAGSIYLNLLQAIVTNSFFGRPKWVDVSVIDNQTTIAAVGCKLDLNESKLDNPFGIIFDPGLLLIKDSYFLIRPIMWSTEHCFLEATTSFGSFSQNFFNGTPCTPIVQIQLGEAEEPRLKFNFTLPQGTFSYSKWEYNRFERANDYFITSKRHYVPPVKVKTLVQDKNNYLSRMEILS